MQQKKNKEGVKRDFFFFFFANLTGDFGSLKQALVHGGSGGGGGVSRGGVAPLVVSRVGAWARALVGVWAWAVALVGVRAGALAVERCHAGTRGCAGAHQAGHARRRHCEEVVVQGGGLEKKKQQIENMSCLIDILVHFSHNELVYLIKCLKKLTVPIRRLIEIALEACVAQPCLIQQIFMKKKVF